MNNKNYDIKTKIYDILFKISFFISSLFLVCFVVLILNVRFLIYPLTDILQLFPSIHYIYKFFL